MLFRKIIFAIAAAFVLSCSQNGLSDDLDKIEAALDSHPDSALLAIERIKSENLSGKSAKARYYLLQAKAIDANFGTLNIMDEASLAKAVEYFDKRGPSQKKAEAWRYLGRVQYNAGHYNKAIVSFTKALESLQDDYDRGLIYRDMAHTYNASFNNLEELACLKKAGEIFEEKIKEKGTDNIGRSLIEDYLDVQLETGKAFYNLEDYAQSEKIFKNVLYEAHILKDTLLEVKCLKVFAQLCLAKRNQEPSAAIDMLGRASGELRSPLSSQDQGLLAYAYSLLGKRKEARKWLETASSTIENQDDKASFSFREYQVKTREGDYEEALKALENVIDYSNSVELQAARKSAVSSQNDYFQEQAALNKEHLRSVRLKLSAAVIILLCLAFASLLYFRLKKAEVKRRLAEEKAETERYMGIAEELQERLKTQMRRLPSEKHLSIAKLDMLERLCEQYYIYEGTDNLQPKILSEVKSAIKGLREDPSVLSGLELMLNRNFDGVVTKLKENFPKMKEEESRLFIFVASGFSSTTIATLTGKEKQYIYNRIYRLKGRISESDVENKELFLSVLSK